MKTILIDGSKLASDVASGISNYIAHVFMQLSRLEASAGLNCKLHFVNAIPEKNVYVGQMKLSPSNTRVDSRTAFVRSIVFGSDLKCDLYHSPYMFIPPKNKRSVNLLTVHDMINLERPVNVRNKSRELMLRLSIRRADYYICISNETRDRLLYYYPQIDIQNVFVVYQGMGSGFTNLPAQIAAPARPFIMYVGQRRDYKNFDSLLVAMSQSSPLSDFELICVGGGGFSRQELAQISHLRLSQRVKHAGYTSELDLKKLYTQATALVYTSLAEGFGLPIIEAMACRCPVICGNFSSMKEIAGGKAILVDNFSVGSLETAMSSAIQFSDLQKDDARKYAIAFTWEKTARETLHVYQSILS